MNFTGQYPIFHLTGLLSLGACHGIHQFIFYSKWLGGRFRLVPHSRYGDHFFKEYRQAGGHRNRECLSASGEKLFPIWVDQIVKNDPERPLITFLVIAYNQEEFYCRSRAGGI